MKAFFKQVLSTVIGTLVGGLISLLVGIFLVGLVIKGIGMSQSEPIEKHSILHLKLEGRMVDRHRPMDFDFSPALFRQDETMGLFELSKAIDAAKTDDRIDGLFLDFKAFRAGWSMLTTLRRKLEEFKASGKFIYGFANRLSENDMYLMSVADQRFVQPSGEVELNGLGMSEAFLKGLMAKLDLEPKIFRVGRFKAAIEPLILDKMSDENRLQNQTLLDDIWREARQKIAKGSNISEQALDSAAAGLTVSSAPSAKSLGIVSEVKFRDEVLLALAQKSVGVDEELRFVTPGHLLRDKRSKVSKSTAKKIAVIFAEGEIVSGQGDIDSIGSDQFVEDIRNAREDEDVAALVLRVNSPGGDALASDIIWRELDQTQEEIPVVISMGDVAASGGYYIAAGGSHIFAEPTTITGSIGVFGISFNSEKLFKNKAGVLFDRVVTHPYGDFGSTVRDISKPEAESIQKGVERVYARFLDVVTDARGFENAEEVSLIAEGRVWSGARAVELGLVDELGGLDQAIKKASELAQLKDYQIEALPKGKEPFRELLEKFSDEGYDTTLGLIAQSRVGQVLGFLGSFDSKSLSQAGSFAQALPQSISSSQAFAPILSAEKILKSVLQPGIHARMLYEPEIR
jgi:protease IV